MKRLPVESRPSLIATGGHSRRQGERISRRGVTAELDLLPTYSPIGGLLVRCRRQRLPVAFAKALPVCMVERNFLFGRNRRRKRGGAIYATTFLALMTIEVKLLSIELPAVTSPVQQALSQPRHSCSVVDARRAAARASTILASERGWADRADPAAHLCRVLLVHVEKVGHRRTD